jgi:hypothetical protein
VLQEKALQKRKAQIGLLSPRNLNRLMTLLEHYLVQDKALRSPVDYQLKLSNWYLENDIDVRLKRSLRKLATLQDRHAAHTPEAMIQRLRQAHLEMLSSSMNGPASTASFIRYLEALDALYITQKLWGGAELLARSRRSSEKLELPMLEEVIRGMDWRRSPPLQRAYLKLVEWQQQPFESSRLDSFLEQLGALSEALPKSLRRELYLHGLNGATQQSNMGREGYQVVYIKMVQTMHDLGLLYNQSGHLEQWIYSNTILSLLREYGPRRARAFMEQHTKALIEEEREPFGRLAAARILFAEGAYDDVLASAADLPFQEFKHVIHFRILAVKALAEIAMRGWKASGRKDRNASKRLDDGLQAFGHYLRYHQPKIPKRRYEGAMNLIRFLSRFWRLPIGTRSQPTKLLREAEEATLAEKDWLLAYMRQDADRRLIVHSTD